MFGAPMFNKILLANDGSDLSRRAKHQAIHLAKSAKGLEK